MACSWRKADSPSYDEDEYSGADINDDGNEQRDDMALLELHYYGAQLKDADDVAHLFVEHGRVHNQSI